VIATVEELQRQKAGYEALIAAFGKAWERGKPDDLLDLFTPDGVFQPSPFEAQLKGRDALAGYWRDTPTEQAEITFRYGEIYVAGPWFSTEFKVTFRRRRTGQWVDIRGALFCETADGKISEMRMYWDRAAGTRAG
jgi:ketosteroid isomerase-like protein